MRNFLLFILLCIVCFDGSAQLDSWQVIRSFTKENPAFVVDTISGGTEVTIICSHKSYHTFIILGQTDIRRLTDKNIFKHPNICLFMTDFIRNYGDALPEEKILPYLDAVYKYNWPYVSPIPKVVEDYDSNNNFYELSYDSNSPSFYLLVLIQGKFYNDLTYYMTFDYYLSPLKFPDPNAYYPLLVPIFKE